MIKTGTWEEAMTIIIVALKRDPHVFIVARDGSDPEPPLRAWLESYIAEAKEAFASASPCTEPQPCACKIFCLLARASQHAGDAERLYRNAGASVARYLNAN